MNEQMDDWYNVLFSIAAGPLSAVEQDALAKVQCSWVFLNARLGRFFIDIIGPKTRLQNIQDKLIELGRAPIVIGIFTSDGVLVGQANQAEWLKVARDVVTYNPDGSVASTARPTAYVDIHRWAGWADKQI
jgi:hypothetical protein